MRNGLIILVLVIGYLLSGIFVVDEREVAVVKLSADKVLIYAPGVHWRMPFTAKVDQVYTNLRTSYLSMPITLNNNESNVENISVIVNWQVIKPSLYVNFLASHTRKDLDIRLFNIVMNELNAIAKNSNSLPAFENMLNSQAQNREHPELGIDIVNVALVNTKPISKDKSTQSQTNDIESAFTLAKQIKDEADINQQEQLAKLRKMDSGFFDYYMKIRYYQLNAKSKQDVPPLSSLLAK